MQLCALQHKGATAGRNFPALSPDSPSCRLLIGALDQLILLDIDITLVSTRHAPVTEISFGIPEQRP